MIEFMTKNIGEVAHQLWTDSIFKYVCRSIDRAVLQFEPQSEFLGGDRNGSNRRSFESQQHSSSHGISR